MHIQKKLMLAINVLGGAAVLGSYAWGFAIHPGQVDDLWGGVPGWLRPYYTFGMLLAAVGYLTFTYYLLFRVDPETAQIDKKKSYWLFNVIYAGILVPSGLWMPLTWEWLAHPGWLLWGAIRLVLLLVGLSGINLVAVLGYLEPKQPRTAYWLALVGSLLFTLHTAVLDGLLWPIYFLK